MKFMDREYIQDQIGQALAVLFDQDRHLLISDVNERSITHQLAIYLSRQFPDWNVDCEYNRNGEDTKLLEDDYRFNELFEIIEENIRSDDSNARTVYPDIIIHHRGTEENLVIIELKKSTNPKSKDDDIKKLIGLKQQLGYKYAVFIRIICGDLEEIGNYELEHI
jgi:hypothetical protein